MWNYHSTLQCNVANYIVNCVYFGNKTTNPGTCARGLALEVISLTSNDLKVSTKTKAAQMGNLGFGVGLEILLQRLTAIGLGWDCNVVHMFVRHLKPSSFMGLVDAYLHKLTSHCTQELAEKAIILGELSETDPEAHSKLIIHSAH